MIVDGSSTSHPGLVSVYFDLLLYGASEKFNAGVFIVARLVM